MKSSAILDRVRVLLADIAPFDQLPEEEREDLLDAISIEYFEPDAVVIEQGSHLHRGLFFIESGLVRLMDVEQKRLLDKCGEGDLFGSFGLLKGGGSIYEAKAVEPTVCALLDKERFGQLCEKHDDISFVKLSYPTSSTSDRDHKAWVDLLSFSSFVSRR